MSHNNNIIIFMSLSYMISKVQSLVITYLSTTVFERNHEYTLLTVHVQKMVYLSRLPFAVVAASPPFHLSHQKFEMSSSNCV